MDLIDHNFIQELARSYELEIQTTDTGCTIFLNGGESKLSIEDNNGEFTIRDEHWHEHCEDVVELENILSGLLRGTIRVLVKFRGDMPVGNQLQLIEGGEIKVLWQSGALVTPFWREKRYFIIEYLRGHRRVRPA